MVRHALAADLHPAVGPVAQEPELQPQLEIAVLLRGAEEVVVWHASLQASADDRPILDPERLEVPFPAIERCAVENRLLWVSRGQGQDTEEDAEEHRELPHPRDGCLVAFG